FQPPKKVSTDYSHKNGKKISIDINEDKLINLKISGYEFGNSTSNVCCLVLQDWGCPASEMFELIQPLVNNGVKLILFDFYSDIFKFSSTNNVGELILSFYRTVDTIYKPEYIIAQGLTCCWVVEAKNQGYINNKLEPKKKNLHFLMLSPINDFKDYIKGVCKDSDVSNNEKVISGFTEKLGSNILCMISKSFKTDIGMLLLIHGGTSFEQSIASVISNSYVGLGTVKLVEVENVTNEFFSGNNQVIEKVVQYFRKTYVKEKSLMGIDSKRSTDGNYYQTTNSKVGETAKVRPRSGYSKQSLNIVRPFDVNGSELIEEKNEELMETSFNNSIMVGGMATNQTNKFSNEEEEYNLYYNEDFSPTLDRVQLKNDKSISLDSLINELQVELKNEKKESNYSL
ncbi:hypothetical protein HK099_006458, partial [Clydaea vesicula]